MKKITAIIMCIFCAFALVSCNNPNVDTNYDYDYIIDGVGYEEYSEYCVVIGFTDDIGKSVTIQEEINDKPVTSINESAFNGCSLTSITIPDSVTSIDDSAFSGCNSLTSITIPDSVISIGTLAFGDCSSLASITVENGNAIYDSRDNCNAIIETDSNTLIVGCKSTIIPDSVTSIDNYAFSGCNGLTSINIPNSVISIGTLAFGDCSSLASITVENGNAIYDSRDNCNALIETDSDTLVVGCKSTIIPDSVTSIGNYAFKGCSSLALIKIPDSVTWIGDAAFSGCSSLTSINISNNVTFIANGTFFGCSSLTSITIPNSITSIGYVAFMGCNSLTSITIPDSVTSISDSAFNECSSLTSIAIPDSVTSINNYLFSGCSSLTSVTIPNSITWIGDSAFEHCNSLKEVYYSGSNEQWSNISIGYSNDFLLSAMIHFNSEI